MTKQECRERECPFFNDELDNCEVLQSEGCTIDDVDSCVGIRITEEASE